MPRPCDRWYRVVTSFFHAFPRTVVLPAYVVYTHVGHQRNAKPYFMHAGRRKEGFFLHVFLVLEKQRGPVPRPKAKRAPRPHGLPLWSHAAYRQGYSPSHRDFEPAAVREEE